MATPARIPLPEPDTMTPEQRKVLDAVLNGRRGALIGPLRAALHNPALADRWQQLGEILRFKTVFPPALNELAVLVTARRWNSELEWVIHAKAARDAGLPEAIIAAIRDRQSPVFDDEAYREVYDYVRSLQNDGTVSDDCYGAIVKRWGPVGVVELTALTGYYVMVSLTLNAHRIPLPEGHKPELYPAGPSDPTLTPIPASADRQ
ncbi:MAG: carboxymuconolactone decarboxylase family protein [Pseudolabrys sp.]|nr:carboxymuconolactone decarboxylase family protein [Pseudolabrys sp.]